MSYQYITLRENPDIMNNAAEWFHSKWRVLTEAYLSCMNDYLQNFNDIRNETPYSPSMERG